MHAMTTRLPAAATPSSAASCSGRPLHGQAMVAPHARRCQAPFKACTAAALRSSSTSQQHGSEDEASQACMDRRSLLRGSMAAAAALIASPAFSLIHAAPASAFTPAPAGFRLQIDKLDGYQFVYPDSWLLVTSSGNDIFLRNPRNIDENLFVDMSSPSSSRYDSVSDLGTPQEAAARILDQYLTREFMSTRIGIKREGNILSAESRTGSDGRQYYDLAIRMTSYGSANPYVATRDEVMTSYGVEWDRVLLTTLGVANKRLYELRFQTAYGTYDKAKPVAQQIAQSFAVKEVDTTPTVQLPASLRAF